ncbi:carbohydrate sulfotransferase 1-like isoform X2 [Mytilus galloprovincialis]|uniref:carbohydrate sulfotransferase 1-like isoform X2 n=1 Tax=Mytilus galloprovincialis TaxID=29158 RepID=UPI003F7B6DD6
MKIYKNAIMRRTKSVIVLGMIACLLVFKSYFNNVLFMTDQSSKESLRLKELTDTDNHVHPTPIVILTYMRSGSSLVGDILQQSKDVFYLFEPLRLPQFRLRKKQPYYSLDGNERLYSSFLDAGRDIIRNWTTCSLFGLPNITWSDGFLSKSKKAKLYNACKLFESNMLPENETIYSCVNMLKQVCLQANHVVLKVIRLPVDQLEPLMQEFPSMKIVHLIRDPRATVLSQMKFGVITVKSFVTNVIDFCSRIYRDLVTIDILSKKYPERVSTFFYEDLAKDPLKMSKQLYKFTGISYTPEVEKYVFNITMAGKSVNCGNLCTIKSNSSKAAEAWRSKLNMPKARIIDRSCRPVYQRLGFREIKSEEMLKDHEIPLRVERENLNDYRYA